MDSIHLTKLHAMSAQNNRDDYWFFGSQTTKGPFDR